MAGRGGRVHILPPSKIKPNDPYEEVDQVVRIRKLFPDAKERLDAESFRREKIRRNKDWLQHRNEKLEVKEYFNGTYRGQLDVQGKRCGYGILEDWNDNMFEGEWKDDQRHGFFIITYKSGERFEGHFENDKREGEGTMFHVDGSKYHGDYKNDVRHGRGMYWSEHEYYTLQKLWMRNYLHGRLIDEHEIYTEAAEPPKLGFGTHIDPMGRRFEGDFVNFKRHGKGELTYPNGTIELGEWVEGVRQGVGMIRRPVGTHSGQERVYTYTYILWKDDEIVTETPSDKLNYENFFWYDEGGFASHN